MKIPDEHLWEYFNVWYSPNGPNCVEMARYREFMSTSYRYSASEPKIKWLYDKPVKVILNEKI